MEPTDPIYIEFDPFSEEFREKISELSYVRHMTEEWSKIKEHDLSDDSHYCIKWEHLPNSSKATYRTTVAECMDAVIQVFDLEKSEDD